MFHTPKARAAMKCSKTSVEDDRRSLPRFAVPLAIRSAQGAYVDHYGKLGIYGFYFETTEIPVIGQQINVKVALVGLGIEVEIAGTVTRVENAPDHAGVVVEFEDIEFDTERFIARWLDLMNMACNNPQADPAAGVLSN